MYVWRVRRAGKKVHTDLSCPTLTEVSQGKVQRLQVVSLGTTSSNVIQVETNDGLTFRICARCATSPTSRRV